MKNLTQTKDEAEEDEDRVEKCESDKQRTNKDTVGIKLCVILLQLEKLKLS